jgi:hypothetical protein
VARLLAGALADATRNYDSNNLRAPTPTGDAADAGARVLRAHAEQKLAPVA